MRNLGGWGEFGARGKILINQGLAVWIGRVGRLGRVKPAYMCKGALRGLGCDPFYM